MKRFLFLLSLLVTTITGAWADTSGFNGDNNGIKLWYNPNNVTKEIKHGNSGVSTTDLGKVTELYLKEYFVQLWQSQDNLSGATELYYRIYKTSSGASGEYTSCTGNWSTWGDWSNGYRYPKFGNNSLNVNLLSGLSSGEYTLQYYFKASGANGGSDIYCNNGNSENDGNFKVTFTVPAAKIGDNYYATFDEALAAANSAETAQTITLLDNCAYATNGGDCWNITKSMTIDGAKADGSGNYKLSGWGKRTGGKSGDHYTTLLINDGKTDAISVTLKNLTIENSRKGGDYLDRCVEVDGNITLLTLDNVFLDESAANGNPSGIYVGGTMTETANIKVTNCTMKATGNGYPIKINNPTNITIENSYLEGYCGVEFFAEYNSLHKDQGDEGIGGTGSVLTAKNTVFEDPNQWSGKTDGFSVFPIKQEGVEINLENCQINAEAKGSASQAVFGEDDYGTSDEYHDKFTIKGDDTSVFGDLFKEYYAWIFYTRTWSIQGGIYSEDPGSYVEKGYMVIPNPSDATKEKYPYKVVKIDDTNVAVATVTYSGNFVPTKEAEGAYINFWDCCNTSNADHDYTSYYDENGKICPRFVLATDETEYKNASGDIITPKGVAVDDLINTQGAPVYGIYKTRSTTSSTNTYGNLALAVLDADSVVTTQGATTCTITLQQDNDESFTLPVGATFDTNGYTYTGTVSAPAGYTVKHEGNIYSLAKIFTYDNVEYTVVESDIVDPIAYVLDPTEKTATPYKAFGNTSGAVLQATEGQTVVLLKDLNKDNQEENPEASPNASINIDLNGHKIDVKCSEHYISIEDYTVVIKNGTINFTSDYDGISDESGVINIGGENANVTLANDLTITGPKSAVYLGGTDATVTIEGSVSGGTYGLFVYEGTANIKGTVHGDVNGVYASPGYMGDGCPTEVNIYGKVSGGNAGIVNDISRCCNEEDEDGLCEPDNSLDGVINIYDEATVTSENGCGVYMNAGTLNVSGGTITGKTSVVEVESNKAYYSNPECTLDYYEDGETSSYNSDLSVAITITGGTLTSEGDVIKETLVEDEESKTTASSIGSITVSNGLFKSGSDEDDVIFDFAAYTGKNFVSGGYYSTLVANRTSEIDPYIIVGYQGVDTESTDPADKSIYPTKLGVITAPVVYKDGARSTTQDVTSVETWKQHQAVATQENDMLVVPSSAASSYTDDTNVIVATTTASGTSYDCKKLTITDRTTKDSKTVPLNMTYPVPFKAHNAYFNRNLGTKAQETKWGTICLPYPPTDTDKNTYYELTGGQTTDGAITLSFSKVETPEANKPYLFKAGTVESGAVNFTMDVPDGKEVTEPDPAIEGGTTEYKLIGLMKSTSVVKESTKPKNDLCTERIVDANAYYLDETSDNCFHPINTRFNSYPFRCYLSITKSDEGDSGEEARQIVVNFDDPGTATGVKFVESEDGNEVKVIYDLSGRQQQELHKGINIVNGKKVLR